MRDELDQLLCQRYPDIFRERHSDRAETSMCWGFCCGDDWFDIIDSLCAAITQQVKAGKMAPVVASQVKEKSGYLRFYIHDHFKPDSNPEAHRLIDIAQHKAESTCQECGTHFELPDEPQWCPVCRSHRPQKSQSTER